MEELRGEIKQMIYGNFVSQVTCTFAELGVADAFNESKCDINQIAEYVKAKPDYLKRFLRCASDLGYINFFPETGLYELQERGSLLGRNHPHSMREEARLNGAYYRYEPWGHLVSILKNGVDEKYSPTFKSGSLDYLNDKPELLENFHKAMTEISNSENKLIIKDYDFSGYSSILEIGCGEGSLIRSILDKYKHLSGCAFDLPETFKGEVEPGFKNRLVQKGGDFFQEIPDVADLYVMKNVIHNWPQDKALQLLKNIRTAMLSTENNSVAPEEKRLLIIENLIPESDENSIANWMDLNFMVIVDGAERTLNEYREIASDAGLEMTRTKSTSSGRDIMEFSLA